MTMASAWRSGLTTLWLVMLLALAGCSRQVELMAAIPEPEANEILGALQNAGIAAQKVSGKDGMVGIHIAADSVGTAVDLLREQGLPRERFAGMGQVFKKEGLISSPLEERARYLFALSQELGATLNQIDGVIVARVHVVLPERSAIGEASVPSTAAVFIKFQEGHDMELIQPLIRRLVSNSIPGLTPDKVNIVMVPGQSTRARTGAAPVPSSTGQVAADLVPPAPAAARPSAVAAADAGARGGTVWRWWVALALVLMAAGLGLVAWRQGWLPSGAALKEKLLHRGGVHHAEGGKGNAAAG